MGARPHVSIRVGVSATAVGPETKISIQTDGSASLTLRVPVGNPFTDDDRIKMQDYLTMVLDILTKHQDGVDDALRSSFRQRAEGRADRMIGVMSSSVAEYVENQWSASMELVRPPVPLKSKIVGNSAMAQAEASCRLPDGAGYLHILAVAKVLVELWPEQEIIHSFQTVRASITPGPTGSGPEEYLNGPANVAEPFRPSIEDIGALVTRLMNRQKRDE